MLGKKNVKGDMGVMFIEVNVGVMFIKNKLWGKYRKREIRFNKLNLLWLVKKIIFNKK